MSQITELKFTRRESGCGYSMRVTIDITAVRDGQDAETVKGLTIAQANKVCQALPEALTDMVMRFGGTIYRAADGTFHLRSYTYERARLWAEERSIPTVDQHPDTIATAEEAPAAEVEPARVHAVKAKSYMRGTGDDARMVKLADDRTFRTGMEMLHWAVKTGVLRKHGNRVATVGDIHLGRYTRADSFADHILTADHIEAMRVAQARYRAILHHFREVAPGWTKVGEIHYADNSIVEKQQDKDGRVRYVTLVHPHGDVC